MIGLAVFILIAFACEESEYVGPVDGKTRLVIYWKRPSYGAMSDRENAKIYLYDSEEEYLKLHGKPVFSKSLADSVHWVKGTIIPVDYVSFNDVDSIRYWVKVFNANREYVEFNKDFYFIEFPVIKNTTTKVACTITSERVYIKQYTITKIEIHNIPSIIHHEPGDKVSFSIFEDFPPDDYGEKDRVLDDTVMTISESDSILTYIPGNIQISRFNRMNSDPKYFVFLSNTGSTNRIFYRLDMIALLNSNAHYGEEFIQLDVNKKITFKLYVTWQN
jgi:hypothetical protein